VCQPSLRDFSMAHANPGLRPGLSSGVPTGLDFVVAISLVADHVYEELMDAAIA
jgi:hypothetical protein